MGMRVIVTGATGMVGEGVLHECLQHPEVEQVLVINRRTCGVSHPKLKEIIHSNFQDITPIESRLVNFDACFFCLGVSTIGIAAARRMCGLWAGKSSGGATSSGDPAVNVGLPHPK
jgi:N-acetyl-gamma-glutamylphosphate reductase